MALLVSSRNEGNLKLFWFQVHSELQEENYSKSKVCAFNFTQNPKRKGEWLIAMKRKCCTPSKHWLVFAELFTEDSLEQI